MPSERRIHGTLNVPGKHHPVLDLPFWESVAPLGDDRYTVGRIETPRCVAKAEQARRLVLNHGPIGPSVPADVFVWSEGADHNKPWLTRIGGTPWMERKTKWPKNKEGMTLCFLAQICFLDSLDIVPFPLPGDVLLIFGRWMDGWVFDEHKGDLQFVWSKQELKEPFSKTQFVPYGGELPFEYGGVIHRTVQYIDRQADDRPFVAAGYPEGTFQMASMQATSIGTYADLPQGWPFEQGSPETLICSFSSYYYSGDWPLCNVPSAPKRARWGGEIYETATYEHALSLGFGDAGAVYAYRDAKGKVQHGATHF